MDDSADDLLNKIAQSQHQQGASASQDDTVVQEANKVIRAILDLCNGHEMPVTARVGTYAPLPTETGHNEPEPILVTYKSTSTEIQSEEGLPVNASADLARKVLQDCRNGFLDRISEELTRRRSSGMP